MLTVPRDTGCGAILPNRDVGHNWVWEVNFEQRHRQWTTKYGRLGFCHEGRMLLLGKAGGENVWCAMAPNEFFHGEDFSTTYADDPADEHPIMPVGRYRRLILALSYLFSIAQIKDIDVIDAHHPDVDDTGNASRWRATTTIL